MLLEPLTLAMTMRSPPFKTLKPGAINSPTAQLLLTRSTGTNETFNRLLYAATSEASSTLVWLYLHITLFRYFSRITRSSITIFLGLLIAATILFTYRYSALSDLLIGILVTTLLNTLKNHYQTRFG